MTRINVGVPPSELCDKMLLAEHREIKRKPNAVKSGRANLSDIPNGFTLGTGHVKFFYNKLGYLLKRYSLIYAECLSRGLNITPYFDCWSDLPLGDWNPPARDTDLIRARITERMSSMKTKPRFTNLQQTQKHPY